MLKKALYIILVIAFLIGTHLIAHEHNINLGPGAQPSVSVSAGENEATATASLDPLREMELSVEDSPISFTGRGFAYAWVKYYFSEDDDGAIPESPDEWGTIAVTLVASVKPTTTINKTHQENHNQDTDVDAEVDIGVKGLKKIPTGASVDVDIEVDQEEGSEVETTYTLQAGFEKEVTPYHDKQEATVEGNKNHFKFCGAKASLDGMPTTSDCDSYIPSFFEFMTFW
jgi:hypothetical protein